MKLRSTTARTPNRIVELSPQQSRAVRAQLFGNDNFHFATLISNFATPGACRFPSACAFNDDNTGATLQGEGEVNTCVNGNGDSIGFDNTVWWRVNTGAITGVMDIRIDNASAGLTPVFLIAGYNTSTTTPDFSNTACDVANPLSRVYSDSWTIRGSIGMAAASMNPPGTEGTYRVVLSWDPDTDGDNLLDSEDRCPTQRGPASTDGCPDTDGDNIANLDDRCPTQRGPSALRGCPDSDGDRVANIDDACPSVFGTFSRGCPDADGDGNAEGINDACPGERATRDENNNGCQDLGRIVAKWGFKPGTYFNRRTGKILGLSIKKLVVGNLPPGARVTVSCTKHACRKKSKKAGKRGRVSFTKTKGIRHKKLRSGRKLTIRVSLAGFVGDARVYKIKPNDFSRKDYCLNPGSKKLRKSCPTVR